MLNRFKDKALSTMLPAVRKDIADFAGEAEQFDDITMLGFTYLGKETAEGVSDDAPEQA